MTPLKVRPASIGVPASLTPWEAPSAVRVCNLSQYPGQSAVNSCVNANIDLEPFWEAPEVWWSHNGDSLLVHSIDIGGGVGLGYSFLQFLDEDDDEQRVGLYLDGLWIDWSINIYYAYNDYDCGMAGQDLSHPLHSMDALIEICAMDTPWDYDPVYPGPVASGVNRSIMTSGPMGADAIITNAGQCLLRAADIPQPCYGLRIAVQDVSGLDSAQIFGTFSLYRYAITPDTEAVQI